MEELILSEDVRSDSTIQVVLKEIPDSKEFYKLKVKELCIELNKIYNKNDNIQSLKIEVDKPVFITYVKIIKNN